MSKDNEEVKSQVIQPEVEERKDETTKFKQEKIKVEKPKKKTWKKVFLAMVITLIIGIIGGATVLYYLQEKTDIWFIVPNSLTKKLEVDTNKENSIENNKVAENTTKTETKENTVINMDEAYKTLDELYNVATEMYLHFPSKYYTISENSHPSTSDSAVEITDYEKVMTKYFTKAAKAEYEDYCSEGLIEENDKVYMEYADGVIGLDYLTTVFTKVQITEDEIICEVDNMYNGSYDELLNASQDNSLSIVEVEIVHVTSTFKIKKVNGNWKIDSFDYEKMK